MATYAIGDIQGCYRQFRALLRQIGFDPAADRLWLAGDLINRGPDSLDTLRYVRSLGDQAIPILGNHECHFLAVARGHQKAGRLDTLDELLLAPDAEDLIDWVRHWPFFHRDSELGFAMLHAGVPPQWTVEDIAERAEELQDALRGPDCDGFLSEMYGNKPNRWSDKLLGHDRLRFIINCFTRMRFCDHKGRLYLKQKGPLGSQPDTLMPWFEVPGRRSQGLSMIFGHWSQLGFHEAGDCICLDSGCLWGGCLTALDLETQQVYSLDCEGDLQPTGE